MIRRVGCQRRSHVAERELYDQSGDSVVLDALAQVDDTWRARRRSEPRQPPILADHELEHRRAPECSREYVLTDVGDVVEGMPAPRQHTSNVTHKHVAPLVGAPATAKAELADHDRGRPIRSGIDVEDAGTVERRS